jgi:hypothetical protein
VLLMDGLDMTQRRLEAVAELAAQEATRHGLGDREARWVMQAARTTLVKEGSAWRAVQVAYEYAKRLSQRVA